MFELTLEEAKLLLEFLNNQWITPAVYPIVRKIQDFIEAQYYKEAVESNDRRELD